MTWKDRYRQAHENYFKSKYPEAHRDHGCPDPVFPNPNTDTGLKNIVCRFLLWSGHFANITNNKGWSKEKTAPKMNMLSGKVQQVLTGKRDWMYSQSKRGTQDVDSNLKHPNHKFGIPWKIECKTPRDSIKDDQIKFGELVISSGAIYSVVWGPEDFLRQYDRIMRES